MKHTQLESVRPLLYMMHPIASIPIPPASKTSLMHTHFIAYTVPLAIVYNVPGELGPA
jgi:hypothetical protein